MKKVIERIGSFFLITCVIWGFFLYVDSMYNVGNDPWLYILFYIVIVNAMFFARGDC